MGNTGVGVSFLIELQTQGLQLIIKKLQKLFQENLIYRIPPGNCY